MARGRRVVLVHQGSETQEGTGKKVALFRPAQVKRIQVPKIPKIAYSKGTKWGT